MAFSSNASKLSWVNTLRLQVLQRKQWRSHWAMTANTVAAELRSDSVLRWSEVVYCSRMMEHSTPQDMTVGHGSERNPDGQSVLARLLAEASWFFRMLFILKEKEGLIMSILWSYRKYHWSGLKAFQARDWLSGLKIVGTRVWPCDLEI